VLAVGINPPDAAKEWSQEDQAAEGARLSAAGSKTKALEAAPAGDAAAGTVAADAEAPKRGRGRPAGSTKAAVAAKAAPPAALAASFEGGDVEMLDELAQRWVVAGNRRGAMLLLQAAETVVAAMSSVQDAA
jgi:hypothetical protein